ncbi:MAG TPA: hypothetical protein VEQ41_07495 [Solirubrobacterales bacterium]|nr:hypothetical protein [Solirubrobacterales bacterium]
MRRVRVAQLLDLDVALGEGLTPEERRIAAQGLPVQIAVLKEGAWQPNGGDQEPGHLGYLVGDGLVVRRVEVGKGSSVELLGRGDLLRPWQEDASSFCASSWEVVEPAKLAQLGPQAARNVVRWPPLVANLMARGVRRSRALAADAAIASIVGLEDRLLILLWQLAERWGRTGADGVHLTIRLPHRLLAELTGARRPSVTSALAQLQGQERRASPDNGCWVLLGGPPC